MLKSCSYCGKIHDKKFICPSKNESLKKRAEKIQNEENRFRWSRRWKDKAEQIKKRDLYLCQACMHGVSGTMRQYNPHELSVHHIEKLRDAYEKRLDDDNLITLCRMHHEMAERGEISIKELKNMIHAHA